MAKTYIDTVKYVIFSSVDIGGLVEKPDVVGAVFGQTEGLLGDELDLRDLQKNGRIGRIEVNLNSREGRTVGEIRIPSSLDMVETCIIAAALETVDRVGPCEANIKVKKVEDTRNTKRKVLIDRAKLLLKNLISTELPESKEISDMVRDEVKTAEVTSYGPDRLSAGPNIQRFNEIVVVEGRADVINLLKNDIANVIAIGGAKVPPSMIRISKEREITVFLDGDRGGDIILNELVQGGVEIDFVARAPTGKEVEELTRKELIKCLRSRVPFEQGIPEKPGPRRKDRREPKHTEAKPVQKPSPAAMPTPPKVSKPIKVPEAVIAPPKPLTGKVADLTQELEELNNSLRARFYNTEMQKIHEIPVRDVIKALEETKGVSAIVFDGIITQRLVDLAASKSVKKLVGIKKGNVNKIPDGIEIYTKRK